MNEPSEDFEQRLGAYATLAAIGQFVIGAGHLESTMCRVIEWFNGNEAPGTIGDTRFLGWEKLEQRIRADAAKRSLSSEVASLLSEHRFAECMGLRHSLIHGSVNVGDPPGFHINRRFRKGRDAIMIGHRNDLELMYRHVHDLGMALDGLLPETYRRNSGNLIAGVVGMTTEMALSQGIDPVSRRVPTAFGGPPDGSPAV